MKMLEFIAVITLLLLLGLIVLVGLLIQSVATARRDAAAQGATVAQLAAQLEQVRSRQDVLTQTLDSRLSNGQEHINRYLTDSGRTLGELKEQIGKLKSDSERLLQLSADVRSLQHILTAPKLRGQLGEHSLASLLQTILPTGGFKLQYGFRNGRVVDALITLPDYSVSVDAKFPLPSFEKMAAAQTDDEKQRLRRQFQNDVIKHIDKIAADYIRPEEGTLDFALMYIPAENVYYETVIRYESDRTDVLEHALAKKVIPVSPNLLYAYLMTIVMGLHGLQIEQEAASIRVKLQELAKGFDAFQSNWDTLGRHLRNAQNQYDEGHKQLTKFTTQLELLEHPKPDSLNL
jgi:DNA recombination protein RmuC